MNVNFSTAFSDFYHTRCFVIICLILFTLLFSFRLDNTIKWSYWIIFLPIWIWKLTVIIGMIVGSIFWCKLSKERYERENYLQCKGMTISFTTNIFLFIFELLACLNLEESNLLWIVCFVPLFILSIVSIGLTIWSIRYSRSYEIELFCAINILQFIFIALRLDNIITWSWAIVFIPLWITMLVLIIILIYLIIITIIVSRNQSGHNNHSRANKWNIAFAYTFFVVSIIIFEVLLTLKLDIVYKLTTSTLNYSFFVVSIPLHFAYFALIFLCFNSKSGNLAWFGMRRDFCEIFLLAFPCMRLYGNIQIKLCTNSNISDSNNGSPNSIRMALAPSSNNNSSSTNNNNNVITINATSNNNNNNFTRDNRFYFSKEVNKKFLSEYSNDSKNQQYKKNLSNIVLLDMPD